MKPDTDERLEDAIAATDELIALARDAGSQARIFLEMARLQLQLELNGITEDEFSAFCDALEEGKFAHDGCERSAAAHARPRRNSDLRLMRRAWRNPQDPARQSRERAGR